MIHSLPDLLTKRAELSPERVALQDLGQDVQVTYRQLETIARGLAGVLAEGGITVGDRVALACRNRWEFFALLFACAKLGAILAPLNWRMPAAEIVPMLELLEPRLLFHGREELAAAQAARAAGMPTIDLDDGLEALAEGVSPLAGRETWPAEEAWYLLGTSGTTGRPKAVINTYGMALANAINIGTGIDLTGQDWTVNFLPQFHAGGIGLHALPTLFAGGRVSVLPSFDADALIAMVREGRLDTCFGVPAVYLQLSLHPEFDSLDLSGVRSWACGGAPLPDVLVRRFAERGALVCNGMGMTETGPTMFLMDPASVLARIGSVGKPQLLARAKVMRPDGTEAGVDEAGELWFSGPGVTPGYWRDEAATQAAFSSDGWLKSGDIGRKDADGYFHVVGRLKEMFISGGENVYPAEIENVLASHPDVAEASVTGAPDARWGEVGRAYVILRRSSVVTAEALDAFCRERLAAYKAPKAYVFVQDLPRNAMGKVLKRRLVELDA